MTEAAALRREVSRLTALVQQLQGRSDQASGHEVRLHSWACRAPHGVEKHRTLLHFDLSSSRRQCFRMVSMATTEYPGFTP